MNRPPDDDEVDRRFEALMQATFEPREAERHFGSTRAERPKPSRTRQPRAETSSPSAPPHDDWHPQSLDDPAPDYRFARTERWRHTRTATVGMVLMVVGLVGGLAGVFGLRLPSPGPQLFSLASIVGLALLLWQALRARRPQNDPDGTL